ncbi:MAG: glutamine synthetase family protein [Eubacterium sp.]|jgi:glutamine synthetase
MKAYREILDFIEEENVQFIRLAFFDVFGKQKNIAIMPGELHRAFTEGISFYGGAIAGFGTAARSDLFLHPDPTTFSLVPWRPIDGRVAKMFCDITYPDGTPFERDSRAILKQAVSTAREKGVEVYFGPEVEFYVFKKDDYGNPTNIPLDNASYMDVDPEDRGDNIRRDICFTLQEMNITPETSHHEQGPGQNEVDFRYSDALTSADNTATFKWVVKSIAESNGNWVDFSPKPLPDKPGNGMHLNISLLDKSGKDRTDSFMAGILHYILDMTLFLNPTAESYNRLGHSMEAPQYVSWSAENRSQLIRIPASDQKRIELRSPDPTANPYIAYALLIYAGLEGLEKGLVPSAPVDRNLYQVDVALEEDLTPLPSSISEAAKYANQSAFIREHIPASLLDAYLKQAQQ